MYLSCCLKTIYIRNLNIKHVTVSLIENPFLRERGRDRQGNNARKVISEVYAVNTRRM